MPEVPNIFIGVEFFAAPPERVFALLTDLEALARSLPGIQSWELRNLVNLHAIVRPGISLLRGKLDMTVECLEIQPSTSFVMQTDAVGVGIDIQIKTAAQLSDAGEGTRLDWNSELTRLTGLTGGVSRPLLIPLLEQMIRQGWQRARERLTA